MWHLAQSALVSATAGFAAAAAAGAAGFAGSTATATDARSSRADASDTILFILSPLFMVMSPEMAIFFRKKLLHLTLMYLFRQ